MIPLSVIVCVSIIPQILFYFTDIYYNTQGLKEAVPLLNALRIIGSNINQIARKANEINNIYASDIEELRKDYSEICLMLNQFLSTLPSTAA